MTQNYPVMIIFYCKIKKPLLTLALMSMVLPLFAQNIATKQLRENLKNYLLAEDQSKLNTQLNASNNVSQLNRKGSTNTAAIAKILGNFNRNGTWVDINYSDTGVSIWELKTHVDRILLLTKEYLKSDSKYYNDQRTKEVIHAALSYWFKHMPQSKNWWYNKIGVPEVLGKALNLLRSELSEEEYRDALKVMNQSNFGMTGQNKVWLAGNIFYKALLTDDEKLAKQARDTIVSEITISENEGIKSDFSFHQHGPQQQFGNYGKAYLTTMASWANIFTNTDFKLDRTELSILRNLFEKGYNQIVWNGYFDTNSLGRQFYKNEQEQKARAIGFAAYDLMNVDTEHKDIYQNFIKRNFSGEGLPLLTGISNFYSSDMTVYRSKTWFNSIKMSSTRVIGAETVNNENLKGYYLGDGASYISVSGKEYLNIFPVWDWRNLPGVTCHETNKPLKRLDISGDRNNSDFAGGISNGSTGVTAFILNRDSLTARKSYFYINDQMVCLGAGITSTQDLPVVTTLNQSWLNGDVIYLTDRPKILKSETSVSDNNIAWVYHDNITYVPLDDTQIEFSNKVHTGSWSDIIAKYPKDSIAGKIFTVKVKAIQKPQTASYAYAVLPGSKPMPDQKVRLEFEVLQNNDNGQIVKSKDGRVFLIVAYQPLSKTFKELGTIDFKQPGLYQIESINDHWEITLADVTQKNAVMNIVFKGKSYQFKMPGDLYKGKAIHQYLTN